MQFPIELAHYIAKACELPSLFVGKYNNLEIIYIWAISIEDAWHSPEKTTILISSNNWLRGLNYYWFDDESSHLVDLGKNEDYVFPHFKHRNYFESAQVLDGYILSLALLEKNEYTTFSILNPAGQASLELEASFERIHDIIDQKSNHKLDVIVPPLAISKYEGDYLRFIEFTKIFGLSPSFETSSELLGFEYILHVTLNSEPEFVFVKTASDFLGTRFRGWHKGEVIIRFPENSTDWKQLMNEPQIEGESGFGTIVKVVLYLKGETIGTSLKKPTKREEISSLWTALYPLMKRLNKE
jgi:hypothetical protein